MIKNKCQGDLPTYYTFQSISIQHNKICSFDYTYTSMQCIHFILDVTSNQISSHKKIIR